MHAILAPSTDCSSSKLPLIFPCRPGPKTRKHSSNLQLKSYIRESADPIAWLHSLQTIARVIAAIAPFLCLISALTVFESSAVAQTATRSDSTDSVRRIHRRGVRPLRRPGTLDPCCDAG